MTDFFAIVRRTIDLAEIVLASRNFDIVIIKTVGSEDFCQ